VFGVTETEIESINSVFMGIDSSFDNKKLGDWGIVYIVCGAVYGQSISGKSAVVAGLPSSYEAFEFHFKIKEMSGELLAMLFSNYIKKWAHDEFAKKVIQKRLASLKSNVSEEAYDYQTYYLTLGMMLNSLYDLKDDDFIKVKNWAVNNTNGWGKLFFGAGLILTFNEDIRWEKYGSFLIAVSGSKKHDVINLFKYFEKRQGVCR